MIARIGLSALALALLVGSAVGVSLLSPARQQPPVSIALPVTTEQTCVLAGELALSGQAEMTALGEEQATALEPSATTTVRGPVVVSSAERFVAGVLRTSPAAYVPCAEPSVAGMLLVPQPETAELVLVNSDASPATVDLSLFSGEGELTATGMRGIELAAKSSRRIALSVLADGQDLVGVGFVAQPGRVAVLAKGVAGRSVRAIPSAPAADEQVITGIPADAKSVKLLLSNPGEEREAISVRALGQTASFVPASAAEVSLAPQSSVSLDLGQDLAGELAALQLTAVREFAAAVQIETANGTILTLLPTKSAPELAVSTRGEGQLLLTNPGAEPAEAEVSIGGKVTTVGVPVGTSVATPISSGNLVNIEVKADQSLVGAAISPQGVIAALGDSGTAEPRLRDTRIDVGLR